MATEKTVRLGINIDHVATLRRLRDTPYPDLMSAAEESIAGGADQITVHLREDRRHIVDQDVFKLKALLSKKYSKTDLNLEMAATEEMLEIALKVRPQSICVVPEKREERTTEGGLDFSNFSRNKIFQKITSEGARVGVLVSFFIEPEPRDIEMSKSLGARAVELHTGTLCTAFQTKDEERVKHEWIRLERAIRAADALGLLIHAGHGIDYEIAPKLAKLPIREYNIGHAIVCESIFSGIREATAKMRWALGL